MYRTTPSIAGCFLLLAIARPAATQADTPTFGEAVEVNVVNLSVYVTRGGEPVTDLSREDFEIIEDGERVPLTNFYAFQPLSPAAAAMEVDSGEAEPESVGPRAPDPVVKSYRCTGRPCTARALRLLSKMAL